MFFIVHAGTPYLQRSLLKNTIPSRFPWSSEPSQSSITREQRLTKRENTKASNSSTEPCPKTKCAAIIPDLPNVLFIANNNLNEGPVEVIETPETTEQEVFDSDVVTETEQPMHISRSTQTKYCTNYSAHQFRNDPKGMVHFTGLETYNKFLYVLDTLGSGSSKLKYRYFQVEGMSVQDQFFLTLIKLRRHTPDIELGYNFGVSSHFVSNVWVTWVNFMYMQWGELGMWPDKDLVEYVMRSDKFQSSKNLVEDKKLGDQKIASIRSHKEIISGVERTFKILGEPMSVTETKLATRIVNVCFMLHNFRSVIVGENDMYE